MRESRRTETGEHREGSDPGRGSGAPAAPAAGPQPAEGPRPRARRSHRDADFSRAVLDDLYRYPRKRKPIALVLWLVTGALGGHRFYLDRIGTGVLMLLTGGGIGLWWLIDLFLIGNMVRDYNLDQDARKANGLPPRALDFMPPTRGYVLPPFPEWAPKRAGRARLVGDAFVLLVAGTALGAVATSTGNVEAVIAVLALIAITILGARWEALATMPVLRGFDRWNHRLRLFYYTNDPGGPLSLALRPVFGIMLAPFRKRGRAEGRLYLQLGAWFTIIFTIFDLVQAGGGDGIFGLDVGALARDLLQTFVFVYAFAAPIGAILTTHLLLERTDRLLWILSAISVVAIGLGAFGGGF